MSLDHDKANRLYDAVRALPEGDDLTLMAVAMRLLAETAVKLEQDEEEVLGGFRVVYSMTKAAKAANDLLEHARRAWHG